ncbi:succinylglutamate desuccinylase [Mangrovitalea sediminis]|uniref:succinylglutamate desuccinylase n=1 Tax=Mangrovitalea sediminis TaxID=1982043 RepID=UPI000BE4EEE9|nr:succinylglutamate desuccinylase [Mangrovitalea sediminis]
MEQTKENPRHALFGDHRDFLAHTLAHAGESSAHAAAHLESGVIIERLETGILLIRPPLPSQRQLIISAGVHGNETAPIEVCNLLLGEILDGNWVPESATLLIFGNPVAMVQGERFVDHNLNRLFTGVHEKPPYRGSLEGERARQLEYWVDRFVEAGTPLFHYDLHTAIRPSKREKFAVYPFIPGRHVPDQQLAFLVASDVKTLLLQHKTASTFASHSAIRYGAESFTVELGKVQPFGQNDLARFSGIRNSLRQLLGGAEIAVTGDVREQIDLFQVVHEIINTGEDFHLHVPDDVANFTEYPSGAIIWQDRKTDYKVGPEPEAIVFPNRNVPIGQRAGLMVRRCTA